MCSMRASILTEHQHVHFIGEAEGELEGALRASGETLPVPHTTDTCSDPGRDHDTSRPEVLLRASTDYYYCHY